MSPSTFTKLNTVDLLVPMVLVQCRYCKLTQLKHTLDLDSMYRQYWYKTGLNPSMINSVKDVVIEIEKRIELNSGDVVVDTGCNDATMLSMYSNPYLIKVGFDPALNIEKEARHRCSFFINDYFTSDKYPLSILPKVITSIAMFYDLPDINKFVDDICKLLDKDGIWVIQFTDLLSMLMINAFDNICFEHLEYYSLRMLDRIVRDHGLQIFDVTYNDVNGGSVRVYIDRNIRSKTDKVKAALIREDLYMDSFENPIRAFAERVETLRDRTVKYIDALNDSGKIVYALGASTKGNTLLQYYKLTNKQVKKALEVNKDKFGLYTVSTEIPIVSDEGINENPDYLLVLPWHFSDFFIDKYHDYLVDGGRLIFPLPELQIVGWDTENNKIWKYTIKD